MMRQAATIVELARTTVLTSPDASSSSAMLSAPLSLLYSNAGTCRSSMTALLFPAAMVVRWTVWRLTEGLLDSWAGSGHPDFEDSKTMLRTVYTTQIAMS